ncbi:MAG: UPF0104 family protein [Planctomycetales bacterium]|nr:UPF0104 family protein [Planctomycetales bacterium]
MADSLPSAATKSRARRWLTVVVKLAVFAAIVWFVRGTLSRGLAELRQHPVEIDYGWLVVSGVIYVAGAAPAAWFWYRVLLTLGQQVTMWSALRAHFIGHLGKYVPGKAMVIVLRSGLLRGRQLRVAVAAAAVFYETLTMMGVGAFLAATMLAIFVRDRGLSLLLIAVGLMIAATLPTLPPLFRRLAHLAGVARGDEAAEQRLAVLGWDTMALGWLANTIGWLLMTASLVAVLAALGVDSFAAVNHWPRYLATVTLSVVAGFLSLIPGGAGVREIVIMKLLAGEIGDGPAIVAAVLLRIVWLVSEVVVSSILYVCRPAGGVDQPGTPTGGVPRT